MDERVSFLFRFIYFLSREVRPSPGESDWCLCVSFLLAGRDSLPESHEYGDTFSRLPPFTQLCPLFVSPGYKFHH